MHRTLCNEFIARRVHPDEASRSGHPSASREWSRQLPVADRAMEPCSRHFLDGRRGQPENESSCSLDPGTHAPRLGTRVRRRRVRARPVIGVHDREMDQHDVQALLALSLVEGMLRIDVVADSLAVDTLDDLSSKRLALVLTSRASCWRSAGSPVESPQPRWRARPNRQLRDTARSGIERPIEYSVRSAGRGSAPAPVDGGPLGVCPRSRGYNDAARASLIVGSAGTLRGLLVGVCPGWRP